MIVDPEARRVDTSIPNISWVVFHFVLLEKVQILIFKRVAGMMRYLVLNILDHPVLLLDTHGKRTESVLPPKLSKQFACFINVLTGIAFKCSDKIRDAQLRWDANKQMHRVIESTYSNYESSLILCNTGHVSEYLVAKSIDQRTLAIFCAEDNVIQELLMCTQEAFLNRKDVSTLRAFWALSIAFRGLTAPAEDMTALRA
jgi:hypothetical protein